MNKQIKRTVESLDIETYLRLSGFKLTDKSYCNSGGVWESNDTAVVIYEK